MRDRDFKLSPSKHYAFLIAMMLFASLIIVSSLLAPIWVKLGAFLFVSSYGGWIFWQVGLMRGPRAIVRIKHLQDGRWHLYTRGKRSMGELKGDSLVTSQVCVLRFKQANRRFSTSCVIFRDALGKDRYRQLVVAVRMG